ncbi:putative 2-aminoethylphosphonate:pyruvateaminotransferase- likeprotein,putative [Trypanosoma rangeli]|uniref:Putative 2-aminoethylphosphonate:pyruvateaminotransferase-likeprotein,putative n=1 Tax=Trypanosoma rangeli TaxID=5698 RepID=A0A422NWJ2_TRYRA|nr:putative 2-aminoethylphosphonate:pyruvateaminotransferase- likeprotein,putative [Trypanosoma rangeli]RNF09805.1 putative 2-aminoethylphosphonate:pyruvateaminotransferase- likeprotein,putative [Trypanosoma rangeli]|eukprot:RNF09805.1 putative 2-aminoethylphosphonate:pyruvateaminotransferase- likeprotein,putative [Trypanosoma rangeli]
MKLSCTAKMSLGNYAQRHHRKHGILFTAGPLSTSQTVREAQLDDYGSRDKDFLTAVAEVRRGVLKIAKAPETAWTCVPMQGSGTMGVEAAINTIIPSNQPGAFVVLCNGSYSYRMASIVKKRGAAELVTFDTEEGVDMDLEAFTRRLSGIASPITAVGIVHCETSTGMFNPIAEVSTIVRRHHPEATILIDAMSSFGAVDFAVPDVCDILVTSANKCIQGVPGFSLVVARRALLERCRGWSTSFTLDVSAQWEGLEQSGGQFNQTPPVQAIVAFRQALLEHEQEGGVTARAKRYMEMNRYIVDRMTREYGFELFLDPAKPSYGYVITAFRTPQVPNWSFSEFYDRLKDEGFVIYPGKASFADTFRIGTLGDIHMPDCVALMDTVGSVLTRMGVSLKGTAS